MLSTPSPLWRALARLDQGLSLPAWYVIPQSLWLTGQENLGLDMGRLGAYMFSHISRILTSWGDFRGQIIHRHDGVTRRLLIGL